MDPESQMPVDSFGLAMADLRDHLDATALETLREIDVVAESLRGELRLLAERVYTRFDRLETTLREEIVRSHGDLAALIRAGYTDLDRRVTALEQRSPASG